jgi:hypothetical protein
MTEPGTRPEDSGQLDPDADPEMKTSGTGQSDQAEGEEE